MEISGSPVLHIDVTTIPNASGRSEFGPGPGASFPEHSSIPNELAGLFNTV